MFKSWHTCIAYTHFFSIMYTCWIKIEEDSMRTKKWVLMQGAFDKELVELWEEFDSTLNWLWFFLSEIKKLGSRVMLLRKSFAYINFIRQKLPNEARGPIGPKVKQKLEKICYETWIRRFITNSGLSRWKVNESSRCSMRIGGCFKYCP